MIAGLPVAKALEVEPRSMSGAAVLADRHLTHPLQDEQLDLGDICQADVGIVGLPRFHGTGTRSITSWMTISVVSP
jgi:hypothetical protein